MSAQVSDTGRYVCVADNVAGSTEKSFNLNVHGKTHVNNIRLVDHLILSFYEIKIRYIHICTNVKKCLFFF